VTVSKELSKYKLDLLGVQEVRWEGGGTKPVGEYTWRKLHNEELHDVYSSPNIIRMIKSRRMRWAEHVARMEEKRNAYRLLVRKPEGKRPL
jgi:acyl-coenzyme A synthetase/AMP-(fatty) acid ligase